MQEVLSTLFSQEIKQSMEFQYSELEEFHDGNVQTWFNDIVSNSQEFIDDQKQNLNKLEKGIKTSKKELDDSGSIKFSDD